MKKSPLMLAASALVLMSAMPAVAAETEDNASDIFAKGKAGLDFRYRLENVDQTGFSKQATASTLLTKLHYETASYKGFSGFLEATNITVLGEATYNSTVNGNTTRPVVADPSGTELNQAYLQYKGDQVTLKFGRQGVNLDDQRFIGTVAWRQNDQTYDSAVAILTPVKNLTAIYGYVWNVNRVFGDDHPLGNLSTNAHLINVSYSGFDFAKITAYGYLLDLNDVPVYGLSSATYGVRVAGSHKAGSVKVGYQAEYATQSDYKDNPKNFSADFWHLGASAGASGVTASLDYELLGADNGVGFQTPLATLHKFNGWADKFLSTPATGLKDVYGSVAYKVPGEGALSGLLVKAVYHDFSADVGGAHYGHEWDFLASKKLTKSVSALVKTAFYSADSFATDTTKFWVMLTAKF
ncbi:alginate export family protein [Kordiimonas marina]|uniref:alginate export family protein n=1 Tax=Kordiimonas marina TaxID=2872312 RepID=UPI001FF2588F|nr:alginate export family protein [Kordiimonas marina]MCJ9428201.1 alginate export family protein [Kordiimonas marina]